MLLDKKNFYLENISDYISAIPITYYFGFLYLALIKNPIESIFYWKCLFGIVITTLTTDLIKRLPYPEYFWNVTRRPNGAKNTDFLSKNGLCKKDAPGFPSGHMSATSFFATLTILYFSQNNFMGKFVSSSLVLFMGWSRWFKGVHNIPQIIGGTLYGISCAYVTNYFL